MVVKDIAERRFCTFSDVNLSCDSTKELNMVATPINPDLEASPESTVDEIFRKLNSLLKPVEQLVKERKSLKDPKLILKMVSGELPTDEELQTIKEDLKQLQKLVKITLDHQTALQEAQIALSDLDQIIGKGPSPLREIIETVTESTKKSVPAPEALSQQLPSGKKAEAK